MNLLLLQKIKSLTSGDLGFNFKKNKNNKPMHIFVMVIRYTVFVNDLPITLEKAVGNFFCQNDNWQ